MTVKPCPEDCTFDWAEFHKNLDWAIAHMIDEAELGTPPEEYMPSKVSALDLAKYALDKSKLQKGKK